MQRRGRIALKLGWVGVFKGSSKVVLSLPKLRKEDNSLLTELLRYFKVHFSLLYPQFRMPLYGTRWQMRES